MASNSTSAKRGKPKAKAIREVTPAEIEFLQNGILLQTIIEAAGTEEVIRKITGKPLIWDIKGQPNLKEGVHFTTTGRGGNAGHFYYVDAEGNKLNSYTLRHQVNGKNGFCQTFAMMYSKGLKPSLDGLTMKECSIKAAEFLAKYAPKLITQFKKIARKTPYQYDNLTSKELREEIESLIAYRHFYKQVLDEIYYS